jgi:hypothetical protein
MQLEPLEYAEMQNSSQNYHSTPQKVAQSLALTQNLWDEANPRSFEIYGIEFYDRYASTWSTKLTHAYLQDVKYIAMLAPEHYTVMKHSTIFDLIDATDRHEFA